MPKQNIKPICSIVVPAHNESAVIGETLQALTKDALPGEFDIIVICNGCTDETTEVAMQAAPDAKVIELQIASKSCALNTGVQAASNHPIVFLDADIKTSAAAVRSLIHRLNWSGAYMTYGTAVFMTKQCSWAVRAFYRAWQQNPYFDKKKMGGFFAISGAGLQALGGFPKTLNDDEYVRRKLMANSAWAEKAPYKVEAPRTLSDLIKVRSRVYRGNQSLEDNFMPLGSQQKRENATAFMLRLFKQPKYWAGAMVFGLTAVLAHLRNFLNSGELAVWESDQSTRIAAPKGQ